MTEKPKPISNVERTCREEGWMLSSELLKDPLPSVARAFITLDPDMWEAFEESITEDGLKFFNDESGEFDSSGSWTQLAKVRGIQVFKPDWAIPAGLTEDGARMARQIRHHMARRRQLSTGGCRAFYAPPDKASVLCVLEILHDGGDLSYCFNYDKEDYPAIAAMDVMLRLHGFYAEDQNGVMTRIFKSA